jgi:hypothetical protein
VIVKADQMPLGNAQLDRMASRGNPRLLLEGERMLRGGQYPVAVLIGALLCGHAAKASAQEARVDYLGPAAGSAGLRAASTSSESLYLICEAFAAAGESWDTVQGSDHWPLPT